MEPQCDACVFLTINIFWSVEIDSEDEPTREGKDKNIVCDLGSDKVSGNGKLQLYGLNVEDGQSCLVGQVSDAASHPEPAGGIERHLPVLDFQQCYSVLLWP